MGWQEDLADLLGQAPQNFAGSTVGRRLGDFAGSPVGQAAGSIIGPPLEAFNAVQDAPRSGVFGTLGELASIREGRGLISFPQAQANTGQFISDIQQRDLGPLGIAKTPIEIALNLGLDPTTYIGVGLAGRAARGAGVLARAATEAERPFLAAGLRGVEAGGKASQFVWNDALDMGLRAAARTPPAMAVRQGVRGGVEKRFPGIFDLTPQMAHQQEKSGWTNAYNRERQAGGVAPLLPPLTSPTGVPLVPHPHPPGSAPSRIYEQGQRAWQALWRGGPGSTPGPLGIVFSTTDPSVPTATADWTDAHLEQLAHIGTMSMVALEEEAPNTLFSSVRKTAITAPQWRDQMVQAYTEDVIPYLPRIWNRMKQMDAQQNLGLNLPDARFVTAQGYAFKNIDTSRLDKTQELLNRGTLTREQALQKVSDFPMGSPEAVEAAAAHGASLWSHFRTGGTEADFRPGGTYFPTRDQLTGPGGYQRAGAPEAFVQDVQNPAANALVPHDLTQGGVGRVLGGEPMTFGTNRAAWDTYMQQIIGPMAQDELDTLARMSIDILYESYLNAANDWALGGKAFAEGVLGRNNRYELNAIAGERGKVGTRAVRPTQRAGSLGQQLLRDNPKIRRPLAGGQIGDKAAWSEQLRQVLGQEDPITRETLNSVMDTRGGKAEFTGEEVKAALTHLGQTPLEPNTTGGLLPALEQVLNDFEEGKNLPITRAKATSRGLFARAAHEMAMIVGIGQPEKAKMLMHFAAITSSATAVRRNMRLALRALAEWEYGQDDTIFKEIGIKGPDLDKIINGNYLHEGMRKEQKAAVEDLLNRAREQRPTSILDIEGAKVGNLANSFMAPYYRSQLDEMVKGVRGKLSPAMARQVRDDFNLANASFAPDRHISRYENGPTVLNALQQMVTRERGAMAARAAKVPSEEMQAGLWYISRDLQGTTRTIGPQTDFAHVLHKVVGQIWDGNRLPDEESWQTFLNRVEQETGKHGADLYTEAYEQGRQYIFYRIIADAMKDPKVKEALTKAGLPSNIREFSHTVMGLVSRGAHGLYPSEWPQPLGGNALQLGQAVEDMATSGQPAILAFDGSKWTPVRGSYAVPLMDGGVFSAGQAQTARKQVEKLISQPVVADAFDAAAGNRGSQLGVGVVQEGGRYRLSLYALTGDQATAEAGAARAGARHLIDPSGAVVPTGHTHRRGASLPGLLKEMFGDSPQAPRPGMEEARRRGITMAEQDTRNPVSLFFSRVYNPIMDHYNALTNEGLANMDTRGIGDLGAPSWEGDDGGLTRRGYNPAVSAPDNEMLLRTVKDGTTYREVIAKYKAEGEDAKRVLEASGMRWEPNASLADRHAAVGHDPALMKIINRWHNRGIDPLFATPDEMGLGMLDRMVRKEKGLKHPESSVLALMAAAWGEVTLASGKYLTGNMVGNWIAAALTIGPGKATMAMSPREYEAALKTIRQGQDRIIAAEAKAGLKTEMIHNFWGESMPQEIFRGGPREVNSNAARYSPSPTGELAGRAATKVLGARAGKAISKKIGSPLILLNDVATAADVVIRGSVESDQFDRNMWAMMPVFEAAVREEGAAAGLQGFEFSIRDKINTPQGGLYPEALRDKLTELGISDGKATRLMRDYVNLKAKARADAIATMHRALFTYDKTNFDDFVGHFAPFTYWYSRAARFYFEEAIRHPYLIENYMRAHEAIDQIQDDPGMSARQKGFIKLMGTPLGFSLLMNPDALFGVVKIFNMDDNYEPDGQTSMGGVIQTLKNYGFGLYPWLDGTLNMMGMYGNTFEPDLLGIRHKALVGSAINFFRAHAGLDPAGAPYADAMGQLRYSVSSFVDSFTPDWLAQTVTPRAGGSSQEASLDITIESIVLSQNPNMTNQQLLDIMSDPESPEYQHAYQMASDAGLVQQLLNIALPVSFRMRHDARDVRLASMNTIYEAATAAGVQPADFAPRPSDLAFRAKYKQLTGKEWQPADYKTAKIQNDLVNAPIEAKQFVLDQATYQDLGTDKQRRNYDRYTAILFGNDPLTMGNPDPNSRRAVADEWADRHGAAARHVDEMYALRNTFTATHPDYAEFQDWSSRVRDVGASYGGLAEYRRRVAQQNPNAARYFAQQEAYMRAHTAPAKWDAERDRFTVSVSAFNAITGKGSSSSTSPGGMPSRQEQGPYPGYPAADVTLPMMEPPAPAQGGGPQATDWAWEAGNMAQQFGIRRQGYQ